MLDRLFAALILFTRLPFWRLRKVPAGAFARATEWWPAVGWLTGGVTAAALWLTAAWLPMQLAVLLAFAVRLLLTGALHEDGLADCCDGFGGGTNREQRLAIMKDSHIGTYGVLGLLFYLLLLTQTIAALPAATAALLILAGDPFSKLAAVQLTNCLPYVRPLEQSKVGAYRRMGAEGWIVSLLFGLLPLLLFLRIEPVVLVAAVAAPMVLTACLIAFLHRKIGGYTGDCCGAAFLLAELSFYLTVVTICYGYGNLVG